MYSGAQQYSQSLQESLVQVKMKMLVLVTLKKILTSKSLLKHKKQSMIHTSEHFKYTRKPERCKNLPSCSEGLFAVRVQLLGSLHNLD